MWMAKSSGMAAGPNGKVIHLLKTPEEDREWHIMATERVRCDFFQKQLIVIQFACHAIYPFTVHNSMAFSIFTELCNHHHNQFQNIFVTPKGNPTPLSYYHPVSPSLLSPGSPLSVCCLWICLFLPFHTNGSIQYVVLCD